jgi:hypothetical protein
MGCGSQGTDGRNALGVVDAPLNMYYGASIAHCPVEHKYQRQGD